MVAVKHHPTSSLETIRKPTGRRYVSSNRLYIMFLGMIVLISLIYFLGISLFLVSNDVSPNAYNNHHSSSTTRAIFYNVFVPEDEQNAIEIVKEQLTIVGKSNILKNTPIHYTLIGNNSTATISRICTDNDVQCHLLRYTTKGDEDLTLQSLFDYCQSHPDAVVTYMHSKGSFHPSVRNDNLRMMATKSILSDECQTIDGETCNICGARFSTFPHYHMSANMFTSHCSYVQKLIAPQMFRTKMDELMNAVMLSPDPTIPRPSFQQIQNGYSVGTGRFSNEHWLGSHPFLLPCDVYPNDYQTGYKKCPSRHALWKPNLQKSPRYDLAKFMEGTVDRSSWFCGQGRLLEFQFLYHSKPPTESFVWTYYPEPFKGCNEPLEYKQHKDLFRNHSILIKT